MDQVETNVNKHLCQHHQNMEAKYICLEKNCQNTSRLICSECIAFDGPHYLHQNRFVNQILNNLSYIEKELDKYLQNDNFINQQCTDILNKLNQSCQKIIEEVTQSVKQLQEKWRKEIQEYADQIVVKKEEFQQIHKNVSILKENLFENKNQQGLYILIENFTNMDNVSNFLNNLKSKQFPLSIEKNIDKLLDNLHNQVDVMIKKSLYPFMEKYLIPFQMNQSQPESKIQEQQKQVNIQVLGHNEIITNLIKLTKNKFASSSNDKLIKIWSLKNLYSQQKMSSPKSCDNKHSEQEVLLFATLQGHEGHIVSLIKLSQKNLIASGGGINDCTVRIWNYKTSTCNFLLIGHKSVVQSLAQINEVNLASGSYDGTVKVWNISNGQKVQEFKPFDCEISSIIAITQSLMLCSSKQRKISLWELNRFDCIQKKKIHTKSYANVLLKLNRNYFAWGGCPDILVFKVQGIQMIKILKGHLDWIKAMVNLDDEKIASASQDLTIRIWNWNYGVCLATLQQENLGQIFTLIRMNSKQLVSAGEDSLISIWE